MWCNNDPYRKRKYATKASAGMQVFLLSLVWLSDSKVHGANMGPIWVRQDPGGPHVGPMCFAIWDHNPNNRNTCLRGF